MASEGTLTLEIDAYLDWLTVEKGRSAKTISSYRSDLRAYITFLTDAGVTLDRVRPSDVDSYLTHLVGEGRSPATLSRARSSIRGLHRFIVDEGSGDVDPSTNAPSVKVPSRLPKALSEEEVIALLDGVNGTDPLSLRDRAILELLYGTGARVSEVVDLDVGSLAYDEGLLRVRGKGDKERIVPVGRGAQEAIGTWIGPKGRGAMTRSGVPRTDASALFLNTRGRRLTRQGIHLMVADRSRRSGITSAVSPHTLRHSCATHMLARGADIRVVQELLGHASVATTQIYTKVTTDHLIRAYSAAHPRAKGARA